MRPTLVADTPIFYTAAELRGHTKARVPRLSIVERSRSAGTSANEIYNSATCKTTKF